VSFKTRAEAERQIVAWIEEAKDEVDHRISLTDLPDSKRSDVLHAYDILGGRASLSKAAKFFVENARPADESLTLERVFEEYLDGKRRSGRRPRTIEEVQYKLGRFVTGQEGVPIQSIAGVDLDQWLDGRGFTPVTRDAYRRQLVAFFNFAVNRAIRECSSDACPLWAYRPFLRKELRRKSTEEIAQSPVHREFTEEELAETLRELKEDYDRRQREQGNCPDCAEGNPAVPYDAHFNGFGGTLIKNG